MQGGFESTNENFTENSLIFNKATETEKLMAYIIEKFIVNDFKLFIYKNFQGPRLLFTDFKNFDFSTICQLISNKIIIYINDAYQINPNLELIAKEKSANKEILSLIYQNKEINFEWDHIHGTILLERALLKVQAYETQLHTHNVSHHAAAMNNDFDFQPSASTTKIQLALRPQNNIANKAKQAFLSFLTIILQTSQDNNRHIILSSLYEKSGMKNSLSQTAHTILRDKLLHMGVILTSAGKKQSYEANKQAAQILQADGFEATIPCRKNSGHIQLIVTKEEITQIINTLNMESSSTKKRTLERPFWYTEEPHKAARTTPEQSLTSPDEISACLDSYSLMHANI